MEQRSGKFQIQLIDDKNEKSSLQGSNVQLNNEILWSKMTRQENKQEEWFLKINETLNQMNGEKM